MSSITCYGISNDNTLNFIYLKFATQICQVCSLEVKVSKWLAEESEHGWGHSNGVELALLVDIIVGPGLIVVSVEVSLGINRVETEVGGQNLLGDGSSGVLLHVVLTGWLWVLNLESRDALNGVVRDHVLGELVDWVLVGGGVTIESLWESSKVWVHEVSELVDGSWELVHGWLISIPSLEGLGNLFGLSKGFIVIRVTLGLVLHGVDLSVELVLEGGNLMGR